MKPKCVLQCPHKKEISYYGLIVILKMSQISWISFYFGILCKIDFQQQLIFHSKKDYIKVVRILIIVLISVQK